MTFDRKAWLEANKSRLREYRIKRYAENKDKLQEESRVAYRNSREKVLAAKRKYKEEHKYEIKMARSMGISIPEARKVIQQESEHAKDHFGTTC